MDAMTFLRDHVTLFAGVADAELELLAVSSTLSEYPAGATVLFKGATVDGLHVVCAGKVAVWTKAPNKPAVKAAELGAGDVFGETSIVEMGTAGATVKAVDETMVLMIPQEAFRHLLQRDEAFAVRVNTLIRSRKAAPVVPA
jgi:CRP-like cAMP-binding protein